MSPDALGGDPVHHPLLAFYLIGYADLTTLGGTTAFLLLCVFAIVNVAVLVLRRDRVEHQHFHAPTAFADAGCGSLRLPGQPAVRPREADFDPSHLDPSGPVN